MNMFSLILSEDMIGSHLLSLSCCCWGIYGQCVSLLLHCFGWGLTDLTDDIVVLCFGFSCWRILLKVKGHRPDKLTVQSPSS